MIIPSQVSVPASFFSSSSNYYSFKMQARRYSCKNLTLEMDLTNTLAAAVQLVPSPILVNYIRISTGSGAILQTLYSKEIWGYLAMTSLNVVAVKAFLLVGTNPYQTHIGVPTYPYHSCNKICENHRCLTHRNVEKHLFSWPTKHHLTVTVQSVVS